MPKNQGKKGLYALTGLFETPDEIMHAAAVVNRHYKKYDVHTPYPVHGMDDSMGMGESKIGWVTFCVGLSCMLLMLLFITWINLWDYPTVYAGKPLWNLPGYIPILFETTVLTGAVTTVIVMMVFVNGLPYNSHPLHDTDYMRRTSDDRFGVCIEAADPNFDEASARALLTELGAKQIATVNYDTAETSVKMNLLDPRFIGFGALTTLVVSGAAYFLLNHMVFMEPFNFMSVQKRTVAQESSTIFKDGRSMQLPVEGSVARGFNAESFDTKDVASSSKYLSNPLEVSMEMLELGEHKYQSTCSACHGTYAEGDSRLNGKFPAPPTLHSKKIIDGPDGQIYHIITHGQNIMPAYAKQLSREERWAIVHYIRAMQRSLNPKESDLQ